MWSACVMSWWNFRDAERQSAAGKISLFPRCFMRKTTSGFQGYSQSVPSMLLTVFFSLYYYFARPRERWRSIVMSASVCVCLSASISPEPHVRSLNNFCACCLSPWLGPPPAEWRNPKGEGAILGGFLPYWQCIVWAVWRYEFNYKRPIWLKFTYLP